MADTYCVKINFRVKKGWVVSVKICVAAANSFVTPSGIYTAVDGIKAAMAALSTAGAPRATIDPAVRLPYGSSGVYNNAEDYASLTYATSTGSLARIHIPAPLASIFLADSQTVDSANTLVAAFNTSLNLGGDVTAGFVASTGSGALLMQYVSGVRKRSNTRRKFNAYILDPILTEPGE